MKYVKEEPSLENLIELKVELEEAKRVEDIMIKKIKDKNHEQEKLEEEVGCLRKKLEKAQSELTMNIPQMKISEQLDKMLNAQRSPLIKARIGYEGENSKSKVEYSKNITFVKAVIKENDNSQQSEIIAARRLIEERSRLCKKLKDDITSMENSEKA